MFVFERVDGNAHPFAAIGEFPMFRNEMAGAEVIRIVASELHAVHTDGQIFAELEMQMGGIHAAIGADPAHLIAAFDLLPFSHADKIEMRIEGIDVFHFTARRTAVGVPDDDAIAPSLTDITRQDDSPVSNGVDGVSKVGVATSVAIPIIAKMTVSAVTAVDVIVFRIRNSNGIIEPVSKGNPGGRGISRNDSGRKQSQNRKKTYASHAGWGKGMSRTMQGFYAQKCQCAPVRRDPFPE